MAIHLFLKKEKNMKKALKYLARQRRQAVAEPLAVAGSLDRALGAPFVLVGSADAATALMELDKITGKAGKDLIAREDELLAYLECEDDGGYLLSKKSHFTSFLWLPTACVKASRPELPVKAVQRFLRVLTQPALGTVVGAGGGPPIAKYIYIAPLLWTSK